MAVLLDAVVVLAALFWLWLPLFARNCRQIL
jgi:hypothetical protein